VFFADEPILQVIAPLPEALYESCSFCLLFWPNFSGRSEDSACPLIGHRTGTWHLSRGVGCGEDVPKAPETTKQRVSYEHFQVSFDGGCTA
jgi:hypothetical protein